MLQKMLQKAIVAALTAFFKSVEGQQLLGAIVLRAVSQSLKVEVKYVDGKSHPGRKIEKTREFHLRDWLVRYVPYLEGAIRGCQKDAATARNRAGDARNMIAGLVDAVDRIAHGEDPAAAAERLAGRHATLLPDYRPKECKRDDFRKTA